MRSPQGWISRYAWGDDYHDVLRAKLEVLLRELRERCGEAFASRVYADTGPVQERVLAKYAGLGWLGKNTLLLNQKIGSYFFLGVILTTLEIPPSLDANSAPPPDLCGSCRRCIEACPTDALLDPYVMDARRCISYLTIELRGSIPEHLREPIGNHVFGCDICQDVCPWNNRAPITGAAEFAPRNFPGSSDAAEAAEPSQSLYRPDLLWLVNLTEEEFRQRFRGSPIKRTKWRGLIRNACIAIGNADFRGRSAGYAEIVSSAHPPVAFFRYSHRGICPMGALAHPIQGARTSGWVDFSPVASDECSAKLRAYPRTLSAAITPELGRRVWKRYNQPAPTGNSPRSGSCHEPTSVFIEHGSRRRWISGNAPCGFRIFAR